jgi:hypothetical protein
MAQSLLASASSAGLDTDAGPLWFKPDTFLDPKFDPNSYVNDLKRYVSFYKTVLNMTSQQNEQVMLRLSLSFVLPLLLNNKLI